MSNLFSFIFPQVHIHIDLILAHSVMQIYASLAIGLDLLILSLSGCLCDL